MPQAWIEFADGKTALLSESFDLLRELVSKNNEWLSVTVIVRQKREDDTIVEYEIPMVINAKQVKYIRTFEEPQAKEIEVKKER